MYIVWFLPLVLIAVLGAGGVTGELRGARAGSGARATADAGAGARRSCLSSIEMPIAFAATFAGVFGAMIGSFLNVVAYRLPRPSRCAARDRAAPGAARAIKTYDNVPVLGWLLLRGRCRSCRTSISPRYPIVEATTAALRSRSCSPSIRRWRSCSGSLLVAVLVPVALIDLDHRIIPNKITLPAAVAAVAIGAALDLHGVPEQLIAAAAAGGFLLFFALAYPRGMGMGDVKLAFVLGLFLGRSVAVAILAGVLIGTVAGAAVMARVGVEQGRKTAVPFGPFLAIGGSSACSPGRRSSTGTCTPASDARLRPPAGPRRGRSGCGCSSVAAAVLGAGLDVDRTTRRAGRSRRVRRSRPPCTPPVRGVLAGSHWNRAPRPRSTDQLEHVSFLAVDSWSPRPRSTVPARSPPQKSTRAGCRTATGSPTSRRCSSGSAPVRADGRGDPMVTPSQSRRHRRAFVPGPAVLLFQHRYLSASLLAALLRCSICCCAAPFVAFGPDRPPAAARPLLVALTPGLDPARRVRWLRGCWPYSALVFVMVGVELSRAVDVIYAAMEGATRLIHGVLPYGHLPPGVIHGDTYPILTYVLYTPLALASPVNTMWDSVDGGLAVAVLAALVAAVAVFGSSPGDADRGTRRPAGGGGSRAASGAGLARVPAAADHRVYRDHRPRRSRRCSPPPFCCGDARRLPGMLAIAGWFKFAPFVLLPVASRHCVAGRLVRALTAIVLVSLPLLA